VAVDKIKYGILGVGIRFSLGTLGVANGGPRSKWPGLCSPQVQFRALQKFGCRRFHGRSDKARIRTGTRVVLDALRCAT
jgi:hypothetical protein